MSNRLGRGRVPQVVRERLEAWEREKARERERRDAFTIHTERRRVRQERDEAESYARIENAFIDLSWSPDVKRAQDVIFLLPALLEVCPDTWTAPVAIAALASMRAINLEGVLARPTIARPDPNSLVNYKAQNGDGNALVLDHVPNDIRNGPSFVLVIDKKMLLGGDTNVLLRLGANATVAQVKRNISHLTASTSVAGYTLKPSNQNYGRCLSYIPDDPYVHTSRLMFNNYKLMQEEPRPAWQLQERMGYRSWLNMILDI